MPQPSPASCAGRAGAPVPDRELQGVIAAVDAGTAETHVTVDPAGRAPAGEGRAVVRVGVTTVVEVERADGTTRRGGAGDLVPGARIRARHTGAELRSFPPQYVATHVRIIPGS